MQTLELECPSCSELLELDVGFAGGVCRCSSCGTLMTVPDESGSGPEKLVRPEDPGSISAMSESGMASGTMQRPDAPIPTRPDSSSPARSSPGRKKLSKGKDYRRSTGRPGKPRGRGKAKSSSKAKAKPERIELGEYRTASGKTVRIDRASDVPTAKQRKGVRIATGIVFMGIVLAIAATAIILVVVLYKPASESEIAQQQTAEQAAIDALKPSFTYNASANPLELENLNILGLPLTPPTAVIYQADTANARWVENFATLLGGGMSKTGNPRPVALFAATGAGVKQLASGTDTSFKADAVTAFINNQQASKQPDLAPAIAQALKLEPTTLVLIVSAPDDAALESWTNALKGHEDLSVHIVFIDGYSSALNAWHRDRVGKYVVLTRDKLEDWVEEAP